MSRLIAWWDSRSQAVCDRRRMRILPCDEFNGLLVGLELGAAGGKLRVGLVALAPPALGIGALLEIVVFALLGRAAGVMP